MIGKIVYLANNVAHIEIDKGTPINENLMNMHIIFEDKDCKILGEVQDIDTKIIKVRFLGEIIDKKFVGGVIRKPTLKAKLKLITKSELKLITGEESDCSIVLGTSPLYDDCTIRVDANDIFNNHMAIFGNTGSGKSCGLARLLQNVFDNPKFAPYKANFFLFDVYGEYHNAFKDLNQIDSNYHFKYYTTNKKDLQNQLRIPLWLLDRDDYALLLQAETHSQLTIIEKMLKFVTIFASNNIMSKRYCNHIIAKACMSILFTNQTCASKKNDIYAILESCSTEEFNLEAVVQGLGYRRKFRDLFVIDTAGRFPESNLMIDYITSFIDDSLDKYETNEKVFYTLSDLEKALSFTLISEGLLRNEKMYNEAVMLKVRLHALAIGENKEYFNYPRFINIDNYIASLMTVGERSKAQIINFNLEDIDTGFAKTITKIFAKMLFNFSKELDQKATIPFHIFLEESHRYVQNDSDKFLLGYNIFERVAKEGRKYGVILNLISQRPVDISEDVISQASNFLIFKISHPKDLEYMAKMLPNISSEIVEMQKSLQPGTCVAFGKAFKVPMIVKMEMPNPVPVSGNCDVEKMWQIKKPKQEEATPEDKVPKETKTTKTTKKTKKEAEK